MFKVYKENKILKEKLKKLQDRYNSVINNSNSDFNLLSFYSDKVDRLKEENKKLQKELTQLYEKNYELAKKLNER
jgi:hypothetical protein